MKIKPLYQLGICMVVSLSVITVAFAQSAFGDITQVPENLTVEDAVLKVSTWLMAVLIFLSARLSNRIPLLKQIPSKWFMALSVAIAIGYVLFKMGFTTGNQAVLAFVGSSAFHELLKLLIKKEQNPIPQTSESNNQDTDEQ
jgi:hypothetical protein